MKDLKYIFIFLTVVVLVIGVMCGISQCNRKNTTTVPEVVTITDTVYIDKERIVEHTNTKYITLVDTFYIKGDTLKDTIWLKDLPIEHKVYTDTITTDSTRSIIKASYSGFNPSLDNLYIQTEITQQKQDKYPSRKKFGWNISGGLYGGYGLGINGLTPQIGLGVTIGWGYRIK